MIRSATLSPARRSIFGVLAAALCVWVPQIASAKAKAHKGTKSGVVADPGLDPYGEAAKADDHSREDGPPPEVLGDDPFIAASTDPMASLGEDPKTHADADIVLHTQIDLGVEVAR